MSTDSPTEGHASQAGRPVRITRLLVANRGEIARRVFRTAREMGIETVAVFADGDADAPFVRDADRAVALEGSSPGQSYLDQAKILSAAARTGADAIHPGYGFLSENAEFARAVMDAGLVWVGPPPESIASMGDKIAAKKLMVDADVPVLASVELDGGDAIGLADEIGYPVLVKAAAGGGGRGMRVVGSAAELVDAIGAAQREAAGAFGDDTVFLEKYLPMPRHVEIQILGDQHGNLIHCFERECSIQRRHQKIIEEAPSPALTPELRARMGAAAVTAARTIGYHSAGTVEFLLDGDSFWFLEVNTRLQVEHPVTEEITGLDLVREMLRIAMGEPLGYDQDDLVMEGHAIEVRLYAEDPANDFLPASGTLESFDAPSSPIARMEFGVESGSVISTDFDPMLAKVVVHAPTRSEAALRLALVLQNMTIAGVTTNRDFLVSTLRHEAFLAGDTTTAFIEHYGPTGRDEPTPDDIADACIAAALFRQTVNRQASDALSFMRSGFRNSVMPAEEVRFAFGGVEHTTRYRNGRDGTFTCVVDDRPPVPVKVVGADMSRPFAITLEIDGVRSRSTISIWDDTWHVQRGSAVELTELSRFPDTGAVDIAGGQTAPMPGRVLSITVAVGDRVAEGQTLLVMEAMKMEHTITAPGDATVTEIRCAVDEQVDNGQVLVILEEP